MQTLLKSSHTWQVSVRGALGTAGKVWETKEGESLVHSVGNVAWMVEGEGFGNGPGRPAQHLLLHGSCQNLTLVLHQIKKKGAGDPVTLVNKYLKGKLTDFIQMHTGGSKNVSRGKAALLTRVSPLIKYRSTYMGSCLSFHHRACQS